MELKPVIITYRLTVVVGEDLDFTLCSLDKAKAEELHQVFVDAFGKTNVYPEVVEGYTHIETKVTEF